MMFRGDRLIWSHRPETAFMLHIVQRGVTAPGPISGTRSPLSAFWHFKLRCAAEQSPPIREEYTATSISLA